MSEENMDTVSETTEEFEDHREEYEGEYEGESDNDEALDEITENNEEVTEEEPENGERMFTVKVNGEELKVTEEELLKGYQTRQASDQKFREAAMRTKQAMEVIEKLRSKDELPEILKQLGYDPHELAEELLIEKMKEDALSPEEKELKKLRQEMSKIEKQKKEEEERRTKEQELELINKYTSDYSTQVVDALQESGLPKTPHTVKRMAHYMHQGLQRGYDLQAKDVVNLVKEDYIQEQKALFGNLDSEKLTELLGEDVAKKLRKEQAGKVKKPSSTKPKVTSRHQGKKEKKLTKDEWKSKLARIKGS